MISKYKEAEASTAAPFAAAKHATNELSQPEEVKRIIRQQEQARDAELRLDELDFRSCSIFCN